MGLGDFVDKIGDAIENGIDEVETKAGSIIDCGTYEVADLARDVGADSVASAIQDLGDQIADHQGGEVLERQLGQTKDKTELIRGEPSKIHDVADKLRTMSTSIESTGNALRTIDVADWTGKGATAFHSAFDKQPKLWWTAGDAFSKAAAHLDSWYWAVITGQAKAQEAIDKWEAADKEEKSQKDSWNALSNKDKKKTTLVDTWSPMRDAARDILKNARSQRDSIAGTVVSGLQSQTQEAPTEPPFTARWTDNFEDLNGVYENGKNSFYAGVLTSFTSIAQFARSVDVLDPYNISHPAQYISSMSDLGTGMVVAAADPGATVGAMLSDARQNPFEAAGAITGNVVLTVATGGGGSAKIGVDALDELSNATKVTKATTSVLEDVPSAAPGRALPRGDAPVAPARTEPKPDRVGTPNESGAPSETRPNATKPDAPDAEAPKAGLPHPDGAAPGAAAPEGGGPAAAPHPDGAALQANPVADARQNEVAPDSASPASQVEQPAAQPHPAGEPRVGEVAPESSPGPVLEQPEVRPRPAADPGPVDGSQVPSSGGGTPHEGLGTRPDADAGAPNHERPAALTSDRPNAEGRHVDPDASQSTHREPGTPDPASGSLQPRDREPNAPHQDEHPPDHAAPDKDAPHDSSSDAHSSDQPHDSGGGHPADHEPGQPNPTFNELTSSDHGAVRTAEDAGAEVDRAPHEIEESPDPVDIATGEFLLPQTDITLPGVLTLVLKRRHRSNYRFGRWFGPSWSATLDMRVVVEREGVTLLGEDGIMLAYPHAEVGAAVEPVTGGQRWTLTRTETGGYQAWDPDRELLWHFAPEPGLNGLDAQLGNFAVSAITDRHCNRIRFHYDSDGAPVAVTHSGGYRVEIDTAGGRVTALTVVGVADEGREVRTRVREFEYQDGNLTAVADAVGATTRYDYDEHGRMVSWTDSNETSMLNFYDGAGRVVTQRGTAGILNCDFEYLLFPDGTGSFTRITDSLGGVTTHGFDRDLRLRDLVDPAGGRTHIDYNAGRKPLQVVAPDGATTQYRYTAEGDVAEIIRPDSAQIAVEYLGRNRPISITDVDGSVRRQEWDHSGNLTAAIDPIGGRTEYGYHVNGSVATILGPQGSRRTFEIDAAGLPVAIADPNGEVTRIERDSFGRPFRVTDPLGAATCFEWAPSGKLLGRTDAEGNHESWTWDGEGNLLTHIDPVGGVTRYTYGAFDLLESCTDPNGSVTRYTWDSERRPVGVTNPTGQNWRYEYDQAGRLVRESDYSGAITRYAHDSAGRVATVTPATGVSRWYTHDVLGRVTEIAADSGEWRRYQHDSAGRVLTAISGTCDEPNHTLEFTYTPTGQLASQRLDEASVMQNEYDAGGRRVRRRMPSDAVTTWQWNRANRVSSMSVDGHNISFAYDVSGRQTGWRIDEVAINRNLSAIGRITAQDITAFPASSLNLDSEPRPESRVIRHDSYDYRNDGYLTSHVLTRPGMPVEQRDYTLDAVGRVETIARDGAIAEAYAYDPLSNIINTSAGAFSPSAELRSDTTAPDLIGVGAFASETSDRREYRGNLLVRHGRSRYHYDTAGRLIRKTVARDSRKPRIWHYRYDAFDQLIGVQTPDQQLWLYTYDAFGRRTTKQQLAADGTVLDRTDYAWDGTHLVEQRTIESITRWHYQPQSYTPITQTTHQDVVDHVFYAIITDLVGTPVDLVDPNTAETVATAETKLWGATSWHGSADTPLRFPGQIHDPETGLHYNHHRTYDPATGRFLTQDPLGLAAAPNPSSYPHNPTAWTDPLGLTPCPPGDAGSDPGSDDFTRVGRWMSQDEYENMVGTGTVQGGAGGTTYVASPPDPAAYGRQAAVGTGYTEFDVPTSSLRPAGEPGWAQIPGPDSMHSRLAERKGSPPLEFPPASNISDWRGPKK
ncbi:putative T7SS-secreted protein [Nocardia sp. NBC_01327]|uniref:putative T7SS-secreted protein n=1 Tax=Nocardia sp. NBC_01327 TaxID=2903593 RepID=UPI002E160B6D|nr:DUF6531 domain-containing protein [Nocardia sp. NBC_01327]